MITIDYTYYKIQTDVLNEAINYFSILNEENIFLFLKIKLLHILYIVDTSFRIIDLLFFDIQKFPSNLTYRYIATVARWLVHNVIIGIKSLQSPSTVNR